MAMVVLLVPLGLVGCGDGDPATTGGPDPSGPDPVPPTELPPSFRYRELLATAHHVIRYDIVDHRAVLVAIDLRTGAEQVLSSPEVPPELLALGPSQPSTELDQRPEDRLPLTFRRLTPG